MVFYSEFAAHADRVFPFRPATAAFLRRTLAPATTCLDIGCGTGRYCRALADAGIVCTGIDPDPAMIEQARAGDPQGRYLVLGMDDLERLPAAGFSGAFAIGNVLPHLPRDLVRSFLGQLRDRLRRPAIWIVQTVNFDPLLRATDHRFADLVADDGRVVFQRRYRDITPDRLVFATELRVDGIVRASGEVELVPWRRDDLVAVHADAGFRLETDHADFSGTPYAPDGGGLVAVFRAD